MRVIEGGGPNDEASLAMIAAQLGDKKQAEVSAAKVLSSDPEWSVELYAHRVGRFAREAETDLLIESARKANLPGCMTAQQIRKYPEAAQLKSCVSNRGSD